MRCCFYSFLQDLYDFSYPCSCRSHYFIEKSATQLIKNDRYLLENGVSERSLTHKLAEYLQEYLPEWNIDCEYNRNKGDRKEIDFNEIVNFVRDSINEDNFEELMKDVKDKDKLYEVMKILHNDLREKNYLHGEGEMENFRFLSLSTVSGEIYIKSVFPDIIAHIRGTKNNIFVVEAKKSSNRDESARWFDLIKLALFTKKSGDVKFGYRAGYFIDIPDSIPERFRVSFSRDQLIQNLDRKMSLDSNVWIVEIEPITFSPELQ